MDLRHLHYFLAVADALNVSRAARQLRITQPALSRQIRDLERELGVGLFERGGRQLRLSAAGRDLVERARRVLNEAEAMLQHAQSLRGGDVGELRVGATPQTMERLFPRVLTRFARAYPRVDVRLIEGHPAAVLELLRTGELHIALALHQPERPGSRWIGVVPLLAVSEPTGARVPSDRLELSELRGRPLLLLQRGFGSRELFEAACRVAQVRGEVLLESTAAPTLLALARVGRGVAILPGSVAFDAAGLRVQRLEVNGAPIEAQLAVHWNAERFLPRYAESFMDELAAEARVEYASPSVRASGRRRTKER
jgi:DNA-binding transcriptional LysR family regulator